MLAICISSWSRSRWVSSTRPITSSSSSSSELIRRSSDTISCCIRSRSLGLVISPWSMRSWSRLRRVLTCSTSRSTLRCSTVRSSTTIRRSRAWLSRSVRLVCRSVIRASSGRFVCWWRSWSARASSSWRSRSLSWAAGSAFRGCSSIRCGTARGRSGWCSPGSPPYRPGQHAASPPPREARSTRPPSALRRPGPARRAPRTRPPGGAAGRS